MKHVVAAISAAEGVIGVDSSFVHIAGALRVPVVGVYTAFLGELRAKTFAGKRDWVDAKGCECRRWPCFYHQDELVQGFCEYARFGVFPACVLCVDSKEILEKYFKLLAE
jgi:hypothetical protein